MATFVMFSYCLSETNDRVHLNTYQRKFISEMIGMSPGSEYDGNATDFNKSLWYAFTEILEGDYSQIEQVDLDSESWYSPGAIVNINCEVAVSRYLEKEQSDWWKQMVEVRGEPREGAWSDQVVFGYPEGWVVIDHPGLSLLTEEQVNSIRSRIEKKKAVGIVYDEERVNGVLHFKSPLHPYTTIAASSGSVVYSSSKKTFTIASGNEDLARSIAEEIFNSNYPLSKAKQIAKQHGGRI